MYVSLSMNCNWKVSLCASVDYETAWAGSQKVLRKAFGPSLDFKIFGLFI